MNSLFFKKNKKFILLKNIFNICKQSYKKNDNKKVFGVNNIKEANNNEITFFDNINYEKEAKNSKALACIVNEKTIKYLNKNTIAIVSNNPLIDFYKVVNFFYPNSSLDDEKINVLINIKKFRKKNIFIGKNYLIDKSASIGNNSKIGNNVIIKSNVHIGRNCIIGSNVIIENSILGDNIIIKSGTLIGQTGFGFNFEKKKELNFLI